MVLLYDRTGTCSQLGVNEARQQLFTQKTEQLMDFSLHKLRSSSISRGPPTRLVIAGPR